MLRGERSSDVQSQERVDCEAFQPSCPAETIIDKNDLPSGVEPFLAGIAYFFDRLLSGDNGSIGRPSDTGEVGSWAP